MPRRVEPTAELKATIVDRIEKGWTIVRLGRDPRFPSQPVISKWARADPAFGAALRRAYGWRRAARREALGASSSFHWETAQAFLERVRAGEPVKALVRRRPWPDVRRLRRWQAERPDFAEAFAAAKRLARARRAPPRWRGFDPVAADQVILALASGVPAGRLAAERGLPSKKVLRRWRAKDPVWAGAYRAAWRAGFGRRLRARGRGSRPTPAMGETVARLLAAGESLAAIARRADMPSESTLYAWMRRDPVFAEVVALGREAGAQTRLDRACEAACARAAG